MPRDTVKRICYQFINWSKEELYTSSRSLYTHEDTLRSGDSVLYMGKVVAARYYRKKLKFQWDSNRMILVERGKLSVSTNKARHQLLREGTAIGREVYPVYDAAHPKKAYKYKVDEWRERLECLRLSRTSRSRVEMVEHIHEVVKCIKGMEIFFNIKPTKLEIPENLIPKLCMWRMDGEPIMENWKNLLEKLNGTTENNYKAA